MTLSSNLKGKGVDSVLIYSGNYRDIFQQIEQLGPDMIGYSLMYGSHWKYYNLSKEIREHFPDILQVAGGPFTTFYPQAINEFPVDATAVGESDISLPNLLRIFAEKGQWQNTKGFQVRTGEQTRMNDLEPLLNNLDELPFPDRKLLYDQDSFLKNQEFKSFLSGRGCPYPCTYCFNHKFNEMFRGKGKMIRRKSVNYFIEEVKQTKDAYGCQFAIFEDDIFVMDKAWLEDFCRKFKSKINIPYICYVRANMVNDDVLKLLKESGCQIVRMAIETGNETIRNTILKRNMSDETIIRASDLIHKYGIKLSVSNMIGLPTETIEALNDTVDLNIRCRPEHPTAQFFMPYPNMELSKIAIEKGYFREDLLNRIPKNTWRFTPLLFDSKTKRIMEKTQKFFTLIVKFPQLKKYAPLFYILPDHLLYFMSMIVKILTVWGYFPSTRVGITQRFRAVVRFFSFYGG